MPKKWLYLFCYSTLIVYVNVVTVVIITIIYFLQIDCFVIEILQSLL